MDYKEEIALITKLLSVSPSFTYEDFGKIGREIWTDKNFYNDYVEHKNILKEYKGVYNPIFSILIKDINELHISLQRRIKDYINTQTFEILGAIETKILKDNLKRQEGDFNQTIMGLYLLIQWCRATWQPNVLDIILKTFNKEEQKEIREGLLYNLNNTKILDYIMSYNDLDINILSKTNMFSAYNCLCTPLHVHLTDFENVDIVNALVAYGADVNIKDGDGNTPLHYNSYFHCESYIHLLISKGADPCSENNKGEYPWNCMCKDDDGRQREHYMTIKSYYDKAVLEKELAEHLKDKKTTKRKM